MHLDVRAIESKQCTELYITAHDDAPAAFQAIAKVLRERGAHILLERIFACESSIAALSAMRNAAYGDLIDGVEPSWLNVASGWAIQVHAVSGGRPRSIRTDTGVTGRVLDADCCRWISANGIRGVQTRRVFEQGDALLRAAQVDVRSLVRTWFFLKDIHYRYADFNSVRNAFFAETGIINGVRTNGRLPASTGIGMDPPGADHCLLDLIAVAGDPHHTHRYHSAGRQGSAFDYGSAFARAAVSRSPAGQTLFVSGTAAIDAAGATCAPNDGPVQIRLTMENVLAVMSDLGWFARDAVQAIAYCASPEVEAAFRAGWAKELPWPWLILPARICRPDLVFEVEVTAARQPR